MRRHAIPSCTLAILLIAVAGQADIPHLINYQGILADNAGQPLDGTFDLTFRIYPDSLPATTPLWVEIHTAVAVGNGLFNVILGGTQPIPPDLFGAPERWMGIQVESDPEISPRMRITSVPWALRTAVADSALVASIGTDGDWTVSGDDMYAGVSGSVGIGTATPDASAILDLRSTTKGLLPPRLAQTERDAIPDPPEGLVVFNTTNGCLSYYTSGTWVELCGCTPDCVGKECGDDGCGGSCGNCPPGSHCENFVCVCDTCAVGETTCLDLGGGLTGFASCVEDANGCGHWEVVEQCVPSLDPCFTVQCDPVSGCYQIPAPGATCDDGDPCTFDDTCDGAGNCVGTPFDCDDGNPCTDDYCDGAGNCTNVPVPNGTPCGPSLECQDGECVPISKNDGSD